MGERLPVQEYAVESLERWTEVLRNCAEVIGFLAAAVYFAAKIFFQRVFQRISTEVNIRPASSSTPAGRHLVLDCRIENKADARIELKRLEYRLVVDGQTATQATPFLGNRLVGTTQVYSIDSHSAEHFVAEEVIGLDSKVVSVDVEFEPRMTRDVYLAHSVVDLDQFPLNHGPPAPGDAAEPTATPASNDASTPPAT